MDRKEIRYYMINAAVIMATVLFFIYEYKNSAEIFDGENFLSVLTLMAAVLLVHMVKAGRLYLALYGSEISRLAYLKTYCKVTPVSVVTPFKLGEFFRMYCYGKELGGMLKGVVIILLDRFMDTAALMTVMLLMWVFGGGRMIPLTYIFFVFLMLVFLTYMIFPGLYKFWKKYLIKAKASRNRLSVLKILETLNLIYSEMEGVAKGRGIILYFMSLTAWAVELGSVAVLRDGLEDGDIAQRMTSYLLSALYGGQSLRLKQFVVVSVVLLTAFYFFMEAKEAVRGKRNHE